MKKLLFTAFTAFAILSCGSEDKMPCATCDNNLESSSTYCLYNNGGSLYCDLMSSNACKNYGVYDYGSDKDCDKYLGKLAYCLSGDGCEFLTIAMCKNYGGYYWGDDKTCGGYLPSSSSFAPSSSSISVSDCDANDYKPFITIGSQVWMGKNLNCYAALSKCYDNSQANCIKYGRLYSWAGAMNISKKYNSEAWGKSDVKRQGICPSGWHIPSNAEWETLTDLADGSLKAISGWDSDDNGTNDYDFSALPGGYGYKDGDAYTYEEAGENGYWWTATEEGEGSSAYNWSMSSYSDWTELTTEIKENMYSVRCLKD